MKMSQGADHLRLVLKHDTALDLCLFQVIEGAKGAIGDAFIGQWPQAFTGLQFRRIGRQEEQMDPFGHHEFLAGMPPSSIEHQQDPLRGTCSDRDAAKWESAMVNTSAVTVGSRNHSVWPVAG